MGSFKKVFIFTLAAIASFTLIATITPVALAQTTSTVQEPRCTVGKERLTSRLTAVTNTTEAHTTAYTSLQDTVDTMIGRATEAGYDTSALLAAQALIDTNMITYTTKATAYTTALTAVRDATCEEDESLYNTSLTTAKTALNEVRSANTELKATFIDQVFPALRDYATWLQTNNAGEDQ